MSVPIAYICVILIWSTTPLGISWSGDAVGYEFGVALRMTIGLIALFLITRIMKLDFPWDKKSRRIYITGGISLFSAMSLVYWAAQFIPSGWISVIFGLSPVFTSFFSHLILGENTFTRSRIFGMLLGLTGLSVVFADSFSLSDIAWMGIVGVTLSAMSQALGAVYIKKLKPEMPSISLTTGALMVALPGFILNSYFNQRFPDEIPMQSLYAIFYLALFGTAIGFPLYFYLLKNINAERIALITLITPITALYLGAVLNDEVISINVWIGTTCILSGLTIYEYGKHIPIETDKKWTLRWKRNPL